MREMVKCKGKAFGADDCFGPNNEFQKAARTLTGSDIGPDSVVGQILTIEITPATYVMEVVQPVVEVGMANLSRSMDNVRNGLDDLSRGDFGGFADSAWKEMINPVEGGKQLIESFAHLVGL